MAIEGPLRELGIHDVFQLLDLSRKTGTLRVVSELRDNEGMVAFDKGKVVHAEIHSNPHPLGQLLLRAGKLTDADLARARGLQAEWGDRRRLGEILVSMAAVSQRELERQVRLQIEAVVFELMSWREGAFSFVEGSVADIGVDAQVKISTESLLMEGARRIDEWSRIADKVPNLGVIAVLAPTADDQAGALDLLPNEWEVLAAIDGTLDLRALAASLARSEFDVAKIVYGLLTTGVIELRRPERTSGSMSLPMGDPLAYVQEARRALREGRVDAALDAAREAVTADPSSGAAHMCVGEVMLRMGRVKDAAEALRAAAEAEPLDPEVHRLRGITSIARGDFDEAVHAWGRFLGLAPAHAEAERVRIGLEAAARLRAMVEGATHG
jgi:tetratricopeptide (TPR) repeat protein